MMSVLATGSTPHGKWKIFSRYLRLLSNDMRTAVWLVHVPFYRMFRVSGGSIWVFISPVHMQMKREAHAMLPSIAHCRRRLSEWVVEGRFSGWSQMSGKMWHREIQGERRRGGRREEV
jgi:hypothetical protein